jgi:hypothetical protein
MLGLVTTPPDFGALLQPAVDNATSAFTAAVPLGITVFGLFVGLAIALFVLRKFGLKR